MKKEPVDGGRYRRSVKELKSAAAKIARDAEKRFSLPPGSVRISITKLQPKTRERIVANFGTK
jgi:hypothetical protein